MLVAFMIICRHVSERATSLWTSINSSLERSSLQRLPAMAASCDALVAVISKRWLSAKNPDGQRRIEDPNDLVRLEISAALTRGILVIQVLVGGAKTPRLSVLPDCLRALAGHHAISITEEKAESIATTGRTDLGTFQ